MMTTQTAVAAAQPTEDILSLSRFERYRRAFAALGRVLANPDQTDQVLVFGTYINAGSTSHRIERFYDEADGRRLYAEQRAIDSRLDLVALAALPTDTLGYAYAHFLSSHGLTPDVFDGSPPEFRDARTAYVVQRIRQTHDLWHVVTGYETNPQSEIALQAFTFAQLGAPSSLILAVAGTLKGFNGERTLARDVLAGYRAGRAANKLATFLWEDHWATPLAEVRARLGLTPVATQVPVRAAA